MSFFENPERNSFSPERSIPNIEGFDEYSDLPSNAVEGIVKDIIPEEHLEKCANIICTDEKALWAVYPDALGLYNVETRDIILAGSKSFDETGENTVEVLFHEIGHNAHAVLEEHNPSAAKEWERLHDSSLAANELNGFGFVSEYAKTDASEDFAECYSQYIANPSLLEFMSPEKYTFMKTNVFDGKEYNNVPVMDGQYAVYEKSVADAMNAAKEGVENTDEDFIRISDGASPVSDTFRCFSMVG